MKYTIVYCDPPWQYSNKGVNGAAENHYRTLSTQQLKDLDVYSLVGDNAILLMWATMPMLPDAIEVMRQWGFDYKTVAFTWIKSNKDGESPFMGTGFYTRANAELCLLGTRGSVQVFSHKVPQILFARRGVHSSKPYCMYDKIEELFGRYPRIELFARDTISGWDSLGSLDGDITKGIKELWDTKYQTVGVQCDKCGHIYTAQRQCLICPACGTREG